MIIPTEPVGSVPRPRALQDGMQQAANGTMTAEQLDPIIDEAMRDTIERFEATGSPIISDGEQAKSSFATYPLDGLDNLAPDGVMIPFEDGHTRQLPRVAKVPFRYGGYAGAYVERARRFTSKPLKQSHKRICKLISKKFKEKYS